MGQTFLSATAGWQACTTMWLRCFRLWCERLACTENAQNPAFKSPKGRTGKSGEPAGWKASPLLHLSRERDRRASIRPELLLHPTTAPHCHSLQAFPLRSRSCTSTVCCADLKAGFLARISRARAFRATASDLRLVFCKSKA